MKCKKCGYELEKDWKACPVCSEAIKKKNNVILIIGIISAVIILAVIIIFNVYVNSTGESGVKQYLKKQYDKKFDEITLIQSIENPDTHLDCDGASFGTIKGKGNTEYYLGYCKENDLEFTVTYDTHSKQYKASYEYNLNLRTFAEQLYDKIQSTFENRTEKITYSANTQDENVIPTTIYSRQDITGILSKVRDGYPEKHQGWNYTGLYVYVNMNSFEFCQQEYDNIKMLNNYLIQLEETNELYDRVGLGIYTLDNVYIEFNRLDAVRIYDKFATGKAWGETIEEFIQREGY